MEPPAACRRRAPMRDQLRTLYRVNKPSGILTMAVYRFGNIVYYQCTIPILRPLLLLQLLCGAEFPARCRVGKGLRLPHGSNGIVLHGNAVIGDGVTLFHQVTLGMRDVEEPEAAPHIGSGVVIGRSEEHTSELQSPCNLVCRLLLEKK